MKPGEFQGVGCVLVSDVASIASVAGPLPPERLIAILRDVLEIQQAAICRHGGIIEQFVGSCTIGYWRPAAPAHLAVQAFAASREIVETGIEVNEVRGWLKVAFSVADCAGAFFGGGSVARFQVVGRARSRADRIMRESLGLRAGIACDAESFALLPAAARLTLVPDRAGNYSTPRTQAAASPTVR